MRPNPATVNDPDYGRWLPSFDSLPVGTPESATSPYKDMLQNHSYYVYTTPRPHDWYVAGFALNVTAVQVIGIVVQVSTDEEEENMCLRQTEGSAVLGWPVNSPEPGRTVQINPHWLPLPCAWCLDEMRGSVWGSLDIAGPSIEAGIEAHWSRRECDEYESFYKVSAGHQLRFVISNRFTALLPSTQITVVGMRWLPWDGDQPARRVKVA